VLVGFLTIGGLYLITEHTAHVLPLLPCLLLAVCALMDLLMDWGDGGHGGERGSDRTGPGCRQVPPPNIDLAAQVLWMHDDVAAYGLWLLM